MDELDEIHEAAIKAMDATNLCTTHKQYHGKQSEDCTPQERTMITLAPKKAEDELDEIVRDLYLDGWHADVPEYDGKAVIDAAAKIRTWSTKQCEAVIGTDDIEEGGYLAPIRNHLRAYQRAKLHSRNPSP